MKTNFSNNKDYFVNSFEFLINEKDVAELAPPLLFSEIVLLLNALISEIISDEKRLFISNFGKINFIYNELNVDPKLRKMINTLYAINKAINKKNQDFECTFSHIDFALYALYLFMSLFDDLADSLKDFATRIKFVNISDFAANKKKSNPTQFISVIINERKEIKPKQYEFICTDEENNIVILRLYNDWVELYSLAWKGAKLNIIGFKKTQGKTIYINTTKDSLVILEPDYLVDATDIAECFTNNGYNHNIYFLKKFSPFKISSSLVLGNIVNGFFDSLIFDDQAEYLEVFYNSLKQKPLSALALAIESKEEAQSLRKKSAYHYENLRVILPEIRKGQMSIEPTFISPKFGIKGRLDLLQEFQDDPQKKNVVELKSGKPPNIDYFFKKEKFSFKTGLWNNHLAQTTCYNMLLDTTFSNRIGTSQILYSSTMDFPLRDAPNIFENKRDVVILRNKIIAYEKKLSQNNYIVFDNLTKESFGDLPTFSTSELNHFEKSYRNLKGIEQEYFNRLVSYNMREIFVANTGAYSKDNRSALSSLWDNFANNHDAIFNLTIDFQLSDLNAGYIYLNLDGKNESALRDGDAIVFYPTTGESIYRERIVKGAIKAIDSNGIYITLRNKFIDEAFFNRYQNWNIAEDVSDSNNKKTFSILANFIYSDENKRQLILGLKSGEVTNINNDGGHIFADDELLTDNQKKIINMAINAKDYFLIQGPPGTGKTSYVLRYIVKYYLDNTSSNILLMAYTNRAVDEIASALERITPRIDYIRLGSKESSIKKERLLSEMAAENNINDLHKKISKTRIFCCTTSFAVNNQELFKIKKFDLSIIDEASQIVEAQLTGLLTFFDKFILIGDERQLPAISRQHEIFTKVESELLNQIEMTTLSDSLFARLLKVCIKHQWNNLFGMLTHQARMHQTIQDFPNINFYSNRLNILDEIRQNDSASIFDTNSHLSLEKALSVSGSIFINSTPEHNSKINKSEVALIERIIQIISSKYSKQEIEEKVGIISTFRKQVSEIKKHLNDYNIRIDTVERFQGSERDVVIISLAVNNVFEINSIISPALIDGVIVDRKLNVSLTRAKTNIIIIGVASVLSTNQIYNNLINHHKTNHTYFNIADIN